MCIVTLTDPDERRALNVPCDDATKVQIALRDAPFKSRKSSLVEVFYQIFEKDFRLGRFQVHIIELVAGEYKTLLVDTEGYMEYPIRLVEAVLLARVCDVKIFIRTDLFMRQSTKFDPLSSKTSLPLNILTTERLEQELERAVNDENYRLASVLQEELDKRKEELSKQNKNNK